MGLEGEKFLTRFELMASFQAATEVFEEIRAEARRDFVAMYPLQARIRERVSKHILEGAFREFAMLKHWKSKQAYIELPENVIKALFGRGGHPASKGQY